ncbi:hypothetical protein ACFYE6_12330 [Kocuria sp. CPCC 205316]
MNQLCATFGDALNPISIVPSKAAAHAESTQISSSTFSDSGDLGMNNPAARLIMNIPSTSNPRPCQFKLERMKRLLSCATNAGSPVAKIDNGTVKSGKKILEIASRAATRDAKYSAPA